MKKSFNKSSNKPYAVAITGSFGTGKSFVGDRLRESGYIVIDTDDIVRQILKKQNNITESIVKIFSDAVLSTNNNEYIKRNVLAQIIFKDDKKRKELESLLHPEVRKILSSFIVEYQNEKIIFVLIPLLYETNMQNYYDEVWCVVCDENIQLKRIQEKGFSLDEANGRIKAQLSQNDKAKHADFIIDNSGLADKTIRQINNRLEVIKQVQ